MSESPPGPDFNFPVENLSDRYAQILLSDIGMPGDIPDVAGEDHSARRWAESGLMLLTGAAKGAPRICPVPLASCADSALNAFRALAGKPVLPTIAGSQLLAERAAITGNQRNGGNSASGHSRLVATADGTLGVTLAREEDWQLVPAWLGVAENYDWQSIIQSLRTRSSESLIKQGRLLGLAVVDGTKIPPAPCRWMDIITCGRTSQKRGPVPRVLDLSSLWAGPLCSHLWQAAGAEVTKIESSQRPDGARAGSGEFFDLLNWGKQCTQIDLRYRPGQQKLREFIQNSDIVIEGSRPRALRQMGIIAEEMISSTPGLTWLSITGHGRKEPQANWIAYGDDAGIAAGLSAIIHQVSGEWLICGDAIADPLTGLHAALAGWAAWLRGGGQLIELSLERTVRHCITATAPPGDDYRPRYFRWCQYLQDHQVVPQVPRRRNEGAASAL